MATFSASVAWSSKYPPHAENGKYLVASVSGGPAVCVPMISPGRMGMQVGDFGHGGLACCLNICCREPYSDKALTDAPELPPSQGGGPESVIVKQI